jgi:hypothetical protein
VTQQPKVHIKKLLLNVLKTATAIFALWFIYKRVIEKDQFHAFMEFIRQKSHSTQTVYAITVVILLMFVNWGIEAIKWRILVKQLWPITFKESIKAIFAGATVSFFTPNRVGDFAGRIFFLPTRVRLPSILSTFIGNLSQLIITLSAGLFCLSFYLHYYFNWETHWLMAAKILACFIGVALLILFPAIRRIAYLPFLQSLKKKYDSYVMLLENYSSRQLAIALFLSFLRYTVFSIQYLILFRITGIPITFTLVAMVCIIFFVQAVIPTVAITEFAFRGSVAILVTAPFLTADNEIIIASFALWIINLALPAAIGSLMILYTKIQNPSS